MRLARRSSRPGLPGSTRPDEPQYAIAVLAEGMESGGDYAAPVFAEICDAIADSGKLR